MQQWATIGIRRFTGMVLHPRGDAVDLGQNIIRLPLQIHRVNLNGLASVFDCVMAGLQLPFGVDGKSAAVQ